MTGRSVLKFLAVCVTALLVVPTVPSQAAVAPPEASPPARGESKAATEWRVLQMNLCSSGANEKCGTDANGHIPGPSVRSAVELIANNRPDVITLNEVCERDVWILADALQKAHPGDGLGAKFVPTPDDDHKTIMCDPDDEGHTSEQRGKYGIGIVTHVRPGGAARLAGGLYPEEDPDLQSEEDSQLRAWACASRWYDIHLCTTHADSKNGTNALNQCKFLMDVFKLLDHEDGRRPGIMAGDLNLVYGGTDTSPDVQECVPSGWYRKGGLTGLSKVDHVMATNDLPFIIRSELRITGSDHYALMVTVQRS